MTELEIFNVIRQIVITVTGVPECILADQDAEAPIGEYATVKITPGAEQRGHANMVRSAVTGQQQQNVDVRSQLIASCSVNFYRGNASDRAQRLRQANKRPDISKLLYDNDTGWHRSGPINNLTTLQSSAKESRSQITVYLSYEYSSPVVINSVEQVDLITSNESNTVVFTTNVNSSEPVN